MISNYLANKLLDHVLKNTTYTSPTTVYIALLQAIPVRETATPGSECSAGNYARVAATFGTAAADAKIGNSEAVTFASPNADWAPAATPVVAVAICDTSAGSSWLFAAPVCPFVINNGDPAPTFSIKGILAAFSSCFP